MPLFRFRQARAPCRQPPLCADSVLVQRETPALVMVMSASNFIRRLLIFFCATYVQASLAGYRTAFF